MRKLFEGIALATLFAVSFAARAVELREAHIDVGSSGAPLIATVRVEDYRAAPIDLLTPVAAGDSRMTRLMKAYFASGKAGDTKTFISLFEAHTRADGYEHYPTAQLLSEQFVGVRSVHLSAVLHWGDYQFGRVEYVGATEGGGTRRWLAEHDARCTDDVCEITGDFANSQLGGEVVAAFGDKHDAVPTPGATLLPILPAPVDRGGKAVTTDPIVLHLNRASDRTTLAVTQAASANVTSVYSLGPHICVAVLKSDTDRSVRVLPLQRNDTSWTILSDPSSLDAWSILSSASTAQALRDR